MAVTTVYTYDLNGSKKDFDVPFEYLARRFVQVTLIGQDRKTLTLSSEFRFISKTIIQTTKVWGPADGYERIEVRRNTSTTDRLVDFADGSILRANELNISQVQTLHVAEEARNMVVDTIGADNNGNLDARGRRLVNLADGFEPGDAVTHRQEQAWAASTLGNRNAAEAARDRAVTAQSISESKAGEAMASATTSKAQADRAKSEADRSTAAAGTIGDSVAQAAAAASSAGGKASEAGQSAQSSAASAAAAQTSKDAASALVTTATNTVNTVRMSAKQLGMSEWGFRERPFDGYLLDDGQELDRSLYPAFVAALDAGLLPTVTEAVWQANPAQRGCFVATSSPGKFRMRDRNGMSSGSVGAVVLRGDGAKSAGVTGVIQLDAFQGHKHVTAQRYYPGENSDLGGDGFNTNNSYTPTASGANPRIYTGTPISDGANGVPRTANETRGLNVTGCWMTFAFGSITPLAAAEAASLATAYSAMSSRISTLETRSVWRTAGTVSVTGNKVSVEGVPSWASEIVIDLIGVATNQTSLFAVRPHLAGSPSTTGYVGAISHAISPTGNAARQFTDGIYPSYSDYETARFTHGAVILSATSGGYIISGQQTSPQVSLLANWTSGYFQTTGPVTGATLILPQSTSYTFRAGTMAVRYRA